MMIDLLVFVDLYFFIEPDGEVKGIYWATLSHQMLFDSLEACVLYKDQRGDQIVQELQESFKAFWMQELNAPEPATYVEGRADCYDTSS